MREPFAKIWARASDRKGGDAALESLLRPPAHYGSLDTLTDDRLLAAFTRQIFQSGFVWRVVENKWPDFEALFFGFDIEKMLLLPDEMWEQKAQDPRIIRNLSKVMTIRENAQMLADLADKHGSAVAWLKAWPSSDLVGLWQYLKRHGKRLGGNTGPYALRRLGVDCFMLSQDVEQYLKHTAIFDGGVTSQKSQQAIQAAFNAWQQESGRSFNEISQTIAYSVGDNLAN
ncbi:DNA-3-methyladenine glycosylase I [Gallaecimonas pentaromativorans]|uniref:DNA-3-methyladenine glycosylase I n=1 Tax=Gallaecimonas pentaromativorans TaxID=584787 RepID=A0A3N1P5B3_9GAMM|nr:DNA-3-methyladenine glycosylase I [Gallaecimonas pentaromativorans]ROQ21910.1 DNA-3-methyladenine glycosylase I [Gallaecimonas pentaromativorans]